MKTLGHVFLEMDTDEVYFFVRRGDRFLCVFRVGEIVQWDAAVRA